MKRLKKLNNDYNFPQGLLVKDIDEKIVDKDPITKETYGPSNIHSWESEKDITNQEWYLLENN